MDFGTWFRRRRVEAGFSQEGLARKLGVDRGWVSRVESGTIRLPHETNRQRIHEVFGTTEEQLWSEVDRTVAGVTRHGAGSPGWRLDRAMASLSDDQQQAITRLVEQLIRVMREMETTEEGDDATDGRTDPEA